MSNTIRRGGIPGPESRTGLTRPSMTEAEFERRLSSTQAASVEILPSAEVNRRQFSQLILSPLPGSWQAPPPSRGQRGSRRQSLDVFSECSPSKKTWTKSSGFTPFTWARIGRKSSMTCCGRSLRPWSFTTPGTAVQVEAPNRPRTQSETDGDQLELQRCLSRPTWEIARGGGNSQSAMSAVREKQLFDGSRRSAGQSGSRAPPSRAARSSSSNDPVLDSRP